MRYLRLVLCISGLCAVLLGFFGTPWLATPTPALAQPPRPTLTLQPTEEEHKKKDKEHKKDPTATPTATAEPPTATAEPPTATAEPSTPTFVPLPVALPQTGGNDGVNTYCLLGGALLFVLGMGVRRSRRS